MHRVVVAEVVARLELDVADIDFIPRGMSRRGEQHRDVPLQDGTGVVSASTGPFDLMFRVVLGEAAESVVDLRVYAGLKEDLNLVSYPSRIIAVHRETRLEDLGVVIPRSDRGLGRQGLVGQRRRGRDRRRAPSQQQRDDECQRREDAELSARCPSTGACHAG